jgi:uroporphyrinogen-III synthase
MKFLITRPDNDTQTLSAYLQAKRHSFLLAPMLSIENLPEANLPNDIPTAIAFTSANGVRALTSKMTSMSDRDTVAIRDCRVFTVGPATALAATQAGWNRVNAADGSVASLAEIMAGQLISPEPSSNRNSASVWHIAGRVQAGNLSAELTARGVQAQRVVLYYARPIDGLPNPAKQALEKSEINAVLLYSLRSAEQYLKLTAPLLPTQRAKITALCLSEKIGELMQGEHYRVRVSAATHEAAMYELIDRFCD